MWSGTEESAEAHKEEAMTIHELVTLLNTLEPAKEVCVAFFTTDGTGEIFDIEAVHDHNGHAQLDIYEEEETAEEEGNGAVMLDVTEGTPEAADAAINAFLDLCERRGITQGEKDLIWNAMAMMCYTQVQERHGPFYEAIKRLLAEGEA
jgi:hypothetical protein